MKTLQQIKELYKANSLGGRDLTQLAQFISKEELGDFGLKLNEVFKESSQPITFTRENILKELVKNVQLGAEKAFYHIGFYPKGLSCWTMYEAVRTWNWILEEGLEDLECHDDFAIPYFKKSAEKYDIDISKWLTNNQ